MFPFVDFTRGPVLEPSISGLPSTRLIKHQGILLDQSSCVATQQLLLTQASRASLVRLLDLVCKTQARAHSLPIGAGRLLCHGWAGDYHLCFILSAI